MLSDESTTNSPNSAKFTPVYTDGNPITCENNPAALAGALHHFHLWSVRTNTFETLFKHRAVAREEVPRDAAHHHERGLGPRGGRVGPRGGV